MKCQVWVEPEAQEVEINLDSDDLRTLIDESLPDHRDATIAALLAGANAFAQWAKAIPDGVLREMTTGQRTAVCQFLRDLANRIQTVSEGES